MKRILILTICMFCVFHNAMADCVSGKTTLGDGRQFVEPVNLNRCEKLKAQITDKSATKFKLSCHKTTFKCTAHECPNGLTPDKAGICSGLNSSEQTRFHKNLLTYTYQKRNLFDACASFDPNKIQNKTVMETQSEIQDLKRKVKYACVTDFANYELSTALAIGLIERYNWSNGIGQIRADNCTTQQNNRFKSGGGRSVRCVSDNGIYVEFIFGKMNSMATSREAVAGALCPVFGFQHLDSRGNQHRCHSKNKSYKDMANFLRKSEIMDIKNVDSGYFEILPLRTDINNKDDLSEILNTDLFKDIVTNTTAHIKMLIKQYIQQQLKSAGYTVESIKFYSARTKSFATADDSTWPVEIYACKKNNCKSYIKAFKFKSLIGSPGADLHFASWVSLGAEQMSCLIRGGLFDSKHCFFLEEDIANEKKQCANTNTMIQSVFATPSDSAKAYFDNENNMCVLDSSNKNAKILKDLEIAAQVGMLAITTVATAGAGSALAIGLAAGGVLADGVVLATDIKMNKASVKFLKNSTRCYDANCAKKYFEEEFKHMLQLMDRINDDEFNVIDSEMDRLVKMLDDKYIGDTYTKGLDNLRKDTTGILKNMSTEEKIETVATLVSVALSITNATKGVKALISKSKTRAPKFLKQLDVRINQCPTCKQSKIDDLLKEKQITNAKTTSKAAVFNASETGEASKIETVSDISAAFKKGENTSQPIGLLEEPFVGKNNMPDVIKKLEQDGFRVEPVKQNYGNGLEHTNYRIYAIDEPDVEKAQKKLLESASTSVDRDARLASVGIYYKQPEKLSDWSSLYEQSATELLLKDPDVAKARANWDNMDEYERWKFEHQTNRKIRRQLINEDATPVAYERIEGDGAAYTMQRTGSEAQQTAKKLDGFDGYAVNPKEQTFERAIESIVHENYHYAQDVGKTEVPKWLLDYNLDNYTTTGAGFIGPYHRQPLEVNAQSIGKRTAHDVSQGLAEQAVAADKAITTPKKDIGAGFNLMQPENTTKSVANAPSTTSMEDLRAAFNMGQPSTTPKTTTPKKDIGAGFNLMQPENTTKSVANASSATSKEDLRTVFNVDQPSTTPKTTEPTNNITDIKNNTSTVSRSTSIVNDSTKNLKKQYDDVIIELLDQTGYKAVEPLAEGYDALATKFGFETHRPRDAEEARYMISKIQNQLDETNIILKKYKSSALGETNDFKQLMYHFNKEQELGESYIQWLRQNLRLFE